MSVQTKCGFIALIGLPNAGKSLLLNQMLNRKISIVTQKRNTTRMPVKGILNYKNGQIVFIDTPGIDDGSSELLHKMVESAWISAKDSDIIALVVDSASGFTFYVKEIINKIKTLKQKKYLILNKVDLVSKPDLLFLAKEINDFAEFEGTYMVSAAKNDGIDDLKEEFLKVIPEGPFVYPEGFHTDIPLEIWAAEITREQIMLSCHEEIPYGATVDTVKVEKNDKGLFIYQEVELGNKNHKIIFIGKDGQKIKSIGTRSRLQMCQFLDQQVHLFLNAKVRKGKISLPV